MRKLIECVSYFIHFVPLASAIGIFVVFLICFLYAFFRQPKAKPYLDKSIQQIQLVEKENLTHDTVKFTFCLPSDEYCLGLPAGKHIKIYCPNKTGVIPGEWNGRKDAELGLEEVARKYTPVSSDDMRGLVQLVIKVYRGNEERKFIDGGKVSQYMGGLKIGDVIDISGPFGLLTYHGRGKVSHGTNSFQCRNICMIAGGSGITPMLQILHKSLCDCDDVTEFWLLFANRSDEDILLRDSLEEMACHHRERFRLWYTIDEFKNSEAKESWKYSTGYITEDMLQDHLPPPADDTIVLLCGPPPMVNFVCRPSLKAIGWKATSIYEF